jgi:DNA polymerase III epsilon subunit-like protein
MAGSELGKRSLDDVCDALRIDRSARKKKHGALIDARLCARVFAKLVFKKKSSHLGIALLLRRMRLDPLPNCLASQGASASGEAATAGIQTIKSKKCTRQSHDVTQFIFSSMHPRR